MERLESKEVEVSVYILLIVLQVKRKWQEREWNEKLFEQRASFWLFRVRIR